jgi:hypothetical protein
MWFAVGNEFGVMSGAAVEAAKGHGTGGSCWQDGVVQVWLLGQQREQGKEVQLVRKLAASNVSAGGGTTSLCVCDLLLG